MYHRAARPEDLLEILQLYREYNQGEPLSLSLGLPERHLETNLAIIASFKRLINSSCVLLCCEGTSVLGMAVHYPMPCLPRTQEDILNLTWWQGYPDLAPAIILSDRAVECCSLAVQYRTVMNTPWLNDKVNLILSSLSLWSQHGLRYRYNSVETSLLLDWEVRVQSYHYIELLVTARVARGQGVARGLVTEIQTGRGLVVCVASSQGTMAILRGLQWRPWRRLEPKDITWTQPGRFFTDLNVVTSFVYDKSL